MHTGLTGRGEAVATARTRLVAPAAAALLALLALAALLARPLLPAPLAARLAARRARRLRPGGRLRGERLPLGEAARYAVEGLEEGASYELRVSWPGPAAVRWEFALEGAPPRGHPRRALLDADKLVFSAPRGAPGAAVVVAVRALPASPAAAARRAVEYDVALDRALAGALPVSVLPVAAAALLALGAALAAAGPLTRRFQSSKPA